MCGCIVNESPELGRCEIRDGKEMSGRGGACAEGTSLLLKRPEERPKGWHIEELKGICVKCEVCGIIQRSSPRSQQW